MKTINERKQFRGEWTRSLKRLLLYLIPMALVFSFIVMGPGRMWFLTVFFIGVSAPVILIYLCGVFLLDRFSLDETEATISRPLLPRIRFNNVRWVDVIVRNGMLKVRVKHVFPWMTTLVRNLDSGERDRLNTELLTYFPKVDFHEKSLSDRHIVLGIMGVLLIAGLAYHAYFYHRHVNLRSFPKQLSVENIQKSDTHEVEHRLKKFSFSLPGKFNDAKKEDDDRFLFEDSKKQLFIRVVYKSEKDEMTRGEIMVFSMTGMRDYFDILRTAYGARIGVIPLALKGIILGDLANVDLYEVKSGRMSGFILRARSAKEEIAHILLRDGGEKVKINFFLASRQEIAFDSVKKIAESVAIRKE